MIKAAYRILENRLVATATYRLVLASTVDEQIPQGEFVHLDIPGYYLRRPLSVCEAEGDRLTLLYKVVGEGTRALSGMPEGETLDVLAGLGKGFDADACRKEALLVGGGLGAAPLYPLAKRLKAQGKRVSVVLGFNKKEEIVLEEEFRGLCDALYLTTMDGSAGIRGLVTDALKQEKPSFDFYYSCGPLVMMKAVCALLEGPGEVSLEERMGCGAGFCYGCSIETKNGPRRVCADGPVFRKEELLW